MAKKNSTKKFALLPAKLLRFNSKGKAVEAIPNDDRAFLAKEGFDGATVSVICKSDNEIANFAFNRKFYHWFMRTMHVRKSADRALNASVASVGSIKAWKQQRLYEPFFAAYQQEENVAKGGQL